MKSRTAIVVFILIHLLLCCCEEKEKVDLEPKQIPLPDELAQVTVKDFVPGHLDYRVERNLLEVAKRPFGIALSNDGKRVYIAAAHKGNIVVIDAFDQEVIETWGPFGEYLFKVIPSFDGSYVFTYGLGGQNLFAIDARTGRPAKKIDVGRNISDAKIGPGNTLLVGSTTDKQVTIIDQRDLSVKGKITFSHPIGYIAVGKNGRIACATGGVYSVKKGKSRARQGPVSFFDPKTGSSPKLADVLQVGAHTRSPVFVNEDRHLLVPDRLDGTVRVFDVVNRRLLKIIDVGAGPEKLLLHPDKTTAYTIDTLGKSVTVISTSYFEMLRQIPLPANPEAGIISPDGKQLYLTLPATSLVNNRIAVIDLDQMVSLDLIPTGKDPCRMILSKDGKTLFVTNFIGNSLSIIR